MHTHAPFSLCRLAEEQKKDEKAFFSAMGAKEMSENQEFGDSRRGSRRKSSSITGFYPGKRGVFQVRPRKKLGL
jgi:hypothetical protein